jgi:hypothetical protein
MGLKEKKAIITAMKRCVKCFSDTHETINCTSPNECRRCKGSHHTALCDKQQTRFSSQPASGATVTGSSAITTTACANGFSDLKVKTATVIVVGPNGEETRAILFVDDGSHRSWVTKEISRRLNLTVVAVENIATRVFKKKEVNPAEITNVVEMSVRGTWFGAPMVKITALESDYLADTGPYGTEDFARKLWMLDEKMADDRFERKEKEDTVGILVGVDQMFEILTNEPAIQSPCGLRAYNTKLGRMIAGPSKEKPSIQGQKVIQQLIQDQNHPMPLVTTFTTNCFSSTKVHSREPEVLPGHEETEINSLQRSRSEIGAVNRNRDIGTHTHKWLGAQGDFYYTMASSIIFHPYRNDGGGEGE